MSTPDQSGDAAPASAGGAAGPRKRVVVLDYGSGNLRSAERAVARTGVEVVVTADHEQALAADGLVVPGVGAFAACMAGLDGIDGRSLIARRVAEQKPTLAICVGHQILFDAGIEHGVRATGVGIWPGLVEELQVRRRPHMGWNTVAAAAGSALFDGIEDERFYFVHSYGVRTLDEAPGRRITWAQHEDERFVAAVEDGPLWSTQFHPEKSGESGTALIQNWVATL